MDSDVLNYYDGLGRSSLAYGVSRRESSPPPGFQFACSTPIEDARTWDAYVSWMERMGLDPVESARDFDYQGAFLKNLAAGGNGHWSDEFKKPNHYAFSSGSMYASPEMPGGEWRLPAVFPSPVPGGTPHAAPAEYIDPNPEFLPMYRNPAQLDWYMGSDFSGGSRMFRQEPRGTRALERPMVLGDPETGLQRLMFPNFD